ncbi:uncharacterized protein K02A2.6-like [Cydia pomonella]|uniref:uncharacterized protein K02A2.6-like n=1 Tax=Cydia pomonella TaxID=82600 RepID=UPI002ADDA96D|nr:uncharacterized protein K02A2.6-like [Cydia pomonella]
MAHSYLGSLHNFDYKSGEWSIFKGKLTQFFKVNANSITADNKCAVLITHLSDDSYRLARNLVYPRDLEAHTYDELIAVLDKHFKIKKCSFANKAKFYSATKNPDESLGDWAARLRGLASHCDLGNALETVLTDRFVLGLGSGPERDKLFEQDAATLTFAKALEVAEQAASARQAQAMVGETGSIGNVPIKEEPVFRAAYAASPGRGGARGRASRGGGTGAGRATDIASGSKWHERDVVNRCNICGMKNHSAETCRYKGYKCGKCGVKGHLKKVCKLKFHNIQAQEGETETSCEDCEECALYNLRYEHYDPIILTVLINGDKFYMELDSGSGISVISDKCYKEYFSHIQLHDCNIKLCVYNGHKMTPMGVLLVNAEYNSIKDVLKIYVIPKGGPPLIGRDFMAKFGIKFTTEEYYNNNSIAIDHYAGEVRQLLHSYADLFSEGLGKFNKFKISLRLKENVVPGFFKPRPVPFALKHKVDEELERLVGLGILVPVNFSKYATPIVPVLKENGKIKIAGDYSVTLNKDLIIDKYPMPRIEEVFAKLGGGERFTKLDLSNAYNQFVLGDESRELTTISTTRGLFQYTRLVYGLANAPAIFQRTMETLLVGIDGVSIWLDDVCITGPDKATHLERLREVLFRIKDAGLKLQKDKCEFFKSSVTYLGYVIDKNGLRTCPRKIEAIVNAPRPNNVLDVKRFLGFINYYRKFIPRASSVLNPLHELLKVDAVWRWGPEQEKAFTAIKREMASGRVLTHFDPEARLVLSVDAGPAGLGAVISLGPEGHERPLAFASRALTPSEKKLQPGPQRSRSHRVRSETFSPVPLRAK